MKPIYKLSLAIVASCAVALPLSAFAKDHGKDKNKKEDGGGRQHEEKVQQVEARVSNSSVGKSHGQSFRSERSGEKAFSGQRDAVRASNEAVAVEQLSVAPAPSRSFLSRLHRGDTQQTQIQVSSDQRYTRDNNYGGLWSAESTHRDWNRDGVHRWNSHNYRWYEGGWLIIDGGYSPYFSDDSSTASRVQAKLADRGYYHGPIDGDIGPGSRRAIANYQDDHDLRVTGRINDPLLVSLRME